MQCPSCGTTLSPGTAVCPRCGTHLSTASDAGEIPYIEYGSTAQETVPVPPSPQAGDTAGQSHDSTGTLQERSSIDGDLQTDGITQPFSQQPSPATEPPEQEPVVPATSKQPRRFSAVTVLLLIILILLLVSGGSGLIYYATVVHAGELHIQATAVTHAVLTQQARGTAEVNTRASATVVALTPQQLYTRATSGSPVIDDSLTSPNGSIWYHYNTSDNSCAFTGGAYHIKVYLQGGNNTCPAINSQFKNLAFQVRMTIIKGDAGGLLFHIGQGFYLFLVNQDGSYSLYLDIGVLALLTSGTSSAINTGLNRSNLLTIVAFDGHMYLYVNKLPVARFFDNTYSSGEIALFAGSATSLTDVAFNNVQVWSI
jgi:hypothetical protein